MSRNHTEYYVLKLDDEGYLEPVRMCKTLDRAKRVYAAKGAERVDKWRATPSMCYLRMAYPEKQLNPGTLKRLYRKLRRREADEKKRIERIKKREAAERVADVMERFWESWDTWQGGEKS